MEIFTEYRQKYSDESELIVKIKRYKQDNNMEEILKFLKRETLLLEHYINTPESVPIQQYEHLFKKK